MMDLNLITNKYIVLLEIKRIKETSSGLELTITYRGGATIANFVSKRHLGKVIVSLLFKSKSFNLHQYVFESSQRIPQKSIDNLFTLVPNCVYNEFTFLCIPTESVFEQSFH
jgi:hypothetical protein